MGDEVLQGLKSLRAGHRPIKQRQVTGVVGEARVHHSDDFTGDGVGLEAAWRQAQRWSILTKAAAVLRIKVPLAAHRLALLKQDAVTQPHLAVEILQTQHLAALGVLREILG